MKWMSSICLFVAALAPLGCDRRPAAAPPPVTAIPEETRPTTQQLLSGPYKRFILPGMPLSVEAPDRWKIESARQLIFLEGPTPFDRATIQLAQQLSFPAERADAYIQLMRRDHDRQLGPVKRMDMRNLGNARLIEQISCSAPMSSPKTDVRGDPVVDAQGAPIMLTTTPMQWMITLLVPSDRSVDVYVLNCIGLSSDQYAVDKEILGKILGSLRFEGAGPTTGTIQ